MGVRTDLGGMGWDHPSQEGRGDHDADAATPVSGHIQEPCWLGHLPLGLGDRLAVKGEAGEASEVPMNVGFVRYTEKFEFCPSGAQTAAR